MVLLYYFANMWNVFSDFHSLLYAIPGCICSGCKLLYFIGTYEYSSLEKGQSKGCLGLALFASVLEETGNQIGVKSSSSSTMRGAQTLPYKSGRRSRSPTPASVISGVVLVTTGGLSVAGLLLEVYFVIEKGDIVLTQQIEKLAPRQVQ